MTRRPTALLLGLLTLLVWTGTAHVQTPSQGPAPELRAQGPYSKLPLPRFVSMRNSKTNVRLGPGFQYPVDWILFHRGTPLIVVSEYDKWRKVRSRDGIGGWIHISQLTNRQTVLIVDDETALRTRPETNAQIRALAEAGAILSLQTCRDGWCRVSYDRLRGWVPQTAIWGTSRDLVAQ